MRVLILGVDGYIGWSLALHLLKKGHVVTGLDNFVRRERANSLTPISSVVGRSRYLVSEFRSFNYIANRSLGDSFFLLSDLLKNDNPEAIIHLAEQPSAAWSMKSAEYACITQQENVIGTLNLLWAIKEVCPSAHLIKLGTMGEYGTPNCNIPEGRIPEPCIGGYEEDENPPINAISRNDSRYRCPMGGLLFSRTAGSFYHLSKVMDTLNIEFACRNWGLTSTDIMQGVVFGLNEFENESEITRFDYDECFGTVINRFCAQAIIVHPLTIYGSGSQTRGFLPLKDSLQCIELAILNPPKQGEYRTLNQFENIYSVRDLAWMVAKAANDLKMYPVVENIENPRKEMESHYYNPAHQKLFDLGYKPTTDIQGEITKLISQLLPYRSRVIPEVIKPTINWR